MIPSISLENDVPNGDLKIKVIGVGGAGTGIVGRLKGDFPDEVRPAAIDTDARSLNQSPLEEKLVIGRSVTYGLGSGSEPEMGEKAARADRAAMADLVRDMGLIIPVVGLGGGTGSSAVNVLAEVVAETDALVLAFATMPFSFEGPRRKRIAEESIGELRQLVHGLIPLPNDILLQEGKEDTSMLEAFSVTDCWIGRGIHSLCGMLLQTGLVNQDLSSLRSVFSGRGGKTIFGTGLASGENRLNNALEELYICPLLHLGDRPVQPDRILVNITGSPDLAMAEVNEIMARLAKRFHSREEIIFGAITDKSRGESLELCVLGKAGMEPDTETDSPENSAGTVTEASRTFPDLGTEISKDTKPPAGSKYKSKLRPPKQEEFGQNEFVSINAEARRGYFGKTNRNTYKQEDLDVPTFIRKGIRINIKIK